MSKSYLLSIGFFFTITFGVKAQESDLQSDASIYFEEGKKLLKNDETLGAQKQFLSALNLFEKEQDWSNWYKSISQLRKIGTSLRNYQQTYDSLLVWETRVPESEPQIQGKIIFYQGYFLNNILGKQVEGIKRYKEALVPLTEARDTKFTIVIYENIAFGYSKLGDQLSAIKYGDHAYQLAKLKGKNSKLCSIVNTFGKFYFHDGQHSKAREKYLEALDICKNNDYTYLCLAELYLEWDDLAEAKKYLDLIDTNNVRIKVDYQIALAQYFKNDERYGDALKAQESVIDNLREGWDRRNYIKEIVRYTEILMLNEQPAEAAKNAHIAICEFLDCKDSLDFSTRPSTLETVSEIWIIEALYIKAKYFQNKYNIKPDKATGDEALFYYQFLFRLFDNLRSNYYAAGSKYRMGAYGQKIYADAIDFLFSLQANNPNINHIGEAFELSQKANSFVLKNTISERESLELAGVSSDSINQYYSLSLRLKEQIDKDSINEGFNQLSKNYEDFKLSLETNYSNLKLEPKEYKISISTVQASLDKHSALIKYFQYGNKLYVFIISKTKQYMNEFSLPENFKILLDDNRKAMTSIHALDNNIGDNEKNYLKNSKAIYDVILGDILEDPMFAHIDHLYLVPDGDLKDISFSTLINQESDDWTDPSNYLVNDYAVSYLNYCAQLNQKSDQKPSKREGFVGLGIKYESEFLEEVLEEIKTSIHGNVSLDELSGMRMSPLKFAVEEVIGSSEILDGDYIINDNVNPSSVIERIKNREIVHFSVHALVDNNDYYNSFILLNKDSTENYRLSYKEVLKENVNSDLVVLSACQTGLGHNVTGEGLMSMARAFIQSGSDATMGSCWNAPDKSTMEIMKLFYTNINLGMTKSKALQNAQLSYLTDDMRSTPMVRAPHFWGAWVIYGSDEPINLNSNYNLYFWLAGLTLIFALFIIIKGKK